MRRRELSPGSTRFATAMRASASTARRCRDRLSSGAKGRRPRTVQRQMGIRLFVSRVIVGAVPKPGRNVSNGSAPHASESGIRLFVIATTYPATASSDFVAGRRTGHWPGHASPTLPVTVRASDCRARLAARSAAIVYTLRQARSALGPCRGLHSPVHQRSGAAAVIDVERVVSGAAARDQRAGQFGAAANSCVPELPGRDLSIRLPSTLVYGQRSSRAA